MTTMRGAKFIGYDLSSEPDRTAVAVERMDASGRIQIIDMALNGDAERIATAAKKRARKNARRVGL